eukprot:1176718-Prorocentrum_minimum.AAC.2
MSQRAAYLTFPFLLSSCFLTPRNQLLAFAFLPLLSSRSEQSSLTSTLARVCPCVHAEAAAFKAAYEDAQKKLPAGGEDDDDDDDAADGPEEEEEEEEEGEEKPSEEADKLAAELEGATVEDKKDETA